MKPSHRITHYESPQTEAVDLPLSHDAFERTRREQGFNNGHHGTFWTQDRSRFLYQKPCHRVTTAQEAREGLALLRYATELGILFPETKWGNYQDKDGNFQLFAITPGLTDVLAAQRDSTNERQPLKRVSPTLTGIFDEDSHILDWCRRLDPDFDPSIVPGPNAIVRLLNPYEASHADNWGWDNNGKLFPVDIEVISISNSPNDSAIVHDWYVHQHPVASFDEN